MSQFTDNFDSILKNHNFDTLSIIRADNDCYLVITVGDESHVYLDSRGKKKVYRHAWQIKNWLKKAFGVESESVQVKEIKYEK